MNLFQIVLKPLLIITLSSLALSLVEGLVIKSTTISFISSKVRTSRIHTIAEPQQPPQLYLPIQHQVATENRFYSEETINTIMTTKDDDKMKPSFGIKSNKPVQKHTQMKSLTSFDVKSCWSKAGVGTCFVLEETNHKKFQVVFDLGW